MNSSPRREGFRAILAGQRCLHPASVFDPISARIAADLGFELGMFAGSTAALTVLGAPDLVLLSLAEFAEQASRICRAAELPLLVDADHGFGNALSVKRTVEELETAGVAGLTIEDTWLPAAFGDRGASRLIPVQEGVGKMRAALAGRQDPRLVILGRTSAVAITGLEDALERVRAYEAAGVDGLFLVGVKTRAQLAAISAAVKLPLVLGNATGELEALDYLIANRVRVCLQGHLPFMAGVRAVYETMKALRDGTPPQQISQVASSELMKQVTREAEYQRWTKEFLGA
ncbi:MAG TPA: isocitrate lyase/PEP mutase family protein [Candidatus Methylomirabilis sp.]|nr:isocitrate lyase/PEP mutase family protein [Candidatus Methylomirabilis sp.]HSB81958.1 isocitrate lyase/PEP mutase family protein [Candidatus Methylomirabilis sp.]